NFSPKETDDDDQADYRAGDADQGFGPPMDRAPARSEGQPRGRRAPRVRGADGVLPEGPDRQGSAERDFGTRQPNPHGPLWADLAVARRRHPDPAERLLF